MYIQGKFKTYGDDLTDVYDIRRKVFINEQGVCEEEEFDSYDEIAIFCVVYELNDKGVNIENPNSVATGRLAMLEDGSYKIGRIAVLKEYRGKKYGDMVVKMLVNKAFLSGASKVYVGSQVQAKGFYQSIGFREYGDIYQESGIDHIGMVLEKENLCTLCNHKS